MNNTIASLLSTLIFLLGIQWNLHAQAICTSSTYQPQISAVNGVYTYQNITVSICDSDSIEILGSQLICHDNSQEVKTHVRFAGFDCDSSLAWTDNFILVDIPSQIIHDTCSFLVISKDLYSYPNGSNNPRVLDSTVVDSIPVCIVFGQIDLQFPAATFCLGSPNPLPTGNTSPTSGTFTTLNPNLSIDATTGAILLNQTSIGYNQQFTFATGGNCPDTAHYNIDILPTLPSTATYNGQSSLILCTSGNLLPDASSLSPAGGSFATSSSQLILLNATTGELDLGQSTPGTYQVHYLPPPGCYDTASVAIVLLPKDNAIISYPDVSGNNICQGIPSAQPLFNAGVSGGDFLASPYGLDINQQGVIFPPNSLPNTPFAINYVTPGPCPDTIPVISTLTIEEEEEAFFSFLNTTICENSLQLVLDSTSPSPGIFQIQQNGTWISSPPFSGIVYLNNSTQVGTHTIRRITTGICPDTFQTTFTVLPQEDSNFEYPKFEYCQVGTANPFISGQPGGTFFSASLGMFLDSTTGLVQLALAPTGVHKITYTSPGQCASVHRDSIHILNSPSAIFSYSASFFCSTDSNPSPISIATLGGVFKADTIGLIVDSLNGSIDLMASVPGEYNVIYSLEQCLATSFVSIEIAQTDTATYFTLPTDTFCKDSIAPKPQLVGDSLGTWNLLGGALFFNSSLGSIDLDSTLAGGPYTLEYKLQNGCGDNPKETFWVRKAPLVDLYYPNQVLCDGAPPLPAILNVIPNQPGLFSSPSAGLFSDSQGTIDPQSAGTGTHEITYTTLGLCPASGQSTIQIHPLPQNLKLEVLPDSSLCEGEEIALQLSSSDGIAYGFYQNSILLDSTNFFIQNLIPANGDLFKGWVRNAFGCADTLESRIIVAPRPELVAEDTSKLVIGAIGNEVVLRSKTDDTWLKWQLADKDETISSGTLLSIDSGETTMISVPPLTGHRYSPQTTLLAISSYSQDCLGDTIYLPILFLPQAASIFIPEAITPNGDGMNDTWNVGWAEEISPAEYKLSVFNRAGGKVFEMSPIHPNWDGGNLPDGVYKWVLGAAGSGTLKGGGLTIRRK